MAGPSAEEIAHSAPSRARADQLIDMMSEEQVRHIGQMGDIQAQSAGVLGPATANAMGAFQKGTDYAQAEETQARRNTAADIANRYNSDIAGSYEKNEEALDEDDPASSDGLTFREEWKQNPIVSSSLANKGTSMTLSEEQKTQKWLDSPDPSHPGQTNRQTGAAAQLEGAAQKPAMDRAKLTIDQNNSQSNIALARASVAQTMGALKNTAQDREESTFMAALDAAAKANPVGAPTKDNPNPAAARDAATQKVVQTFQQNSQTGIPPERFAALGKLEPGMYDAKVAAGAAAADTTQTAGTQFSTLKNAADRASSSIAALNGMRRIQQSYQDANFSFSPQGQSALNGILSQLDTLAAPSKSADGTMIPGDGQAAIWASQLRNAATPATKSTTIAAAIDDLSQRIPEAWNAAKSAIPNNLKGRSEYTNTENAVQGIGSAPKWSIDGAGQPGGNGDYLKGPNANKPPPGAYAQPQPVPPPGHAAGTMPQVSPLPVPGQPAQPAQPATPAFAPGLIQPLDDGSQ